MKRSIIGAILTVGLLAAPFAHAQTDYAQIGDPYTDTLQLWSEIASTLSSLGNDVVALFGHQLSSEPTAPTQQGPASLAAAAGSFSNAEAPANTATSNEPTSTTISAPATFSQNIASSPSILSSPTPDLDASNFVTQSELGQLLLSLRNSLANQMGATNTVTPPQNVAADGDGAIPYAAENDIGNLSNVTITNANLTAAEIPTLNYFPSTSTISVAYGGTGISNSPTFGQLLLGNASGGYNLVSTSSLGIAGTNYWTLSGSSLFNNNGTNIGIGTTTPWSDIANTPALLDLTSTTTVRLVLHDTGTTQEEKLSSDGTGFYIDSAGAASASNNNIVFRVSNTNHSYTTYEAGRFTAAGLFGVGTTSPWAQLSASSTSANPVLAIQQNSTGPAAVFLGGSVGIGTTTPSSSALFSVGTSTSLLYVDNNTGAVDIGSTNASVAPFYVAGKYTSSVVATTAPAGSEGSIVIQGSYVYSVNSNNDTFEISDISNPANPALLATTTPFGVGGACIMGLSVLGRYAYVTSDCQSQTAIYDISNPTNPVLLSDISNENYPTFQAVQGKYLYEGENPIIFYDISDPHNPVIVFDQTPSAFTSGYTPISAVPSGRYLYTVGVNSAPAAGPLAVQVIDVSNVSNPIVVDTTVIGNWTGYSVTYDQLAVQGRYLYTISDDPNELLVVDISNPKSPVLVGSLGLAGTPNAIKVEGRYAYIAQSNGVAVYDVSNASSPVYLGLLTSTNTYDLGILGRYAVTSAGEVLNLGGAYVQSLEAGALSVGTLNVDQTSTFLNGLETFGGLSVGAPGIDSSGPVGITSEGGASNILSVTAATTSQSTGKTTTFSAESITNNATSSTASIIKSGLNIISQGSWTGTGASNIGLYVSSVTGGTNNYDAIFNGGGNVGVGTSTPYSRLQVTGPNTASTSAFAVVNSASTTVFSVFDNGNSTYSGSIFQSSDQRLKTDVTSLGASSSLSAIELLNPVSYLRLDQPGTGENLGFIAQQVQQVFPQLVSTTTATALTLDGTLTLNYEGLISPIVSAIQAIANVSSTFQQNLIAWLGNAENGIGDLFANNIHAQSELCVGSTCVTPAQFQSIVAAANVSQSSEQGSGTQPSDDPTDDTPPVIEVNGDNPAIVQVGTTYNDLGATITGPQQDLNLGINTFVNGVAMSPIQIDTSAIATDTIDYVATDQSGLTSTSTRTVIIDAPANDNTPPSVATTASSTSTPS